MTLKGPYSMEKQTQIRIQPCPFLPVPAGEMSYRDLRQDPGSGQDAATSRFTSACTYANYLWMSGVPARAILALCRAIYLDPKALHQDLQQPYIAYVWFLQHHDGRGFLGNPRLSFLHQATRINDQHALKRHRAWAMWYLTVTTNPAFPTDPAIAEHPPTPDQLQAFLNEQGLRSEGAHWLEALHQAGQNPPQMESGQRLQEWIFPSADPSAGPAQPAR